MKNNGRRQVNSGESGFAMLLVFLMAAVIAISLYIQIPRVAFEAQRQKEQLLMERGQQYQRAIQLFVRVNGRYPSKIDDLENFNNRRFLRHKFKDPMTGKTEWRLIHINAAGVFTDSLTNKPKPDDKNQSISTASSVAQIPDLGLASAQGQQQNVTNAATRRRVSEGGTATTVGPDGQPIPSQNAGIPGAPAGQAFPGQAFPGQAYPGQPYPGAPQASNPSQPYPTSPTPDPNTAVGQPGYALVTPNPQMGNNPAAPGGAPVPPDLTNPAGGALPPGQQGQQAPGQFGQPGQPGQPGQFGQPGQPVQQAPFRPPVPVQQPGLGAGNQSSMGSSSIGGASSSIGGGQSSVGGDSSIGGGTSSLGGGVNPGQNRAFPQPVPPPAQSFQQATPGFAQPGQAPPADPGGFATAPTPTSTPGSAFAPPNQQVSNPATSMIQNMLTTPRQAPQSTGAGGGTGTGIGGAQPGGQQIGAGIAGVASTAEDASIMVFKEKTHYNEWEFIFDYTKQQSAAPNANSGVNGTPVQNMGTVAGQGAGGVTPGGGIGGNSGFGNNAGFGNNGGFGQGASPQGQQGQQAPPPSDLRMGQQ